MKTACFLLLTIVCAALMHGMAHAAPSGQVSETASADGAATTASNHGGTAAQSSSADSANGRDTDGQRDHRRTLGRSHAISVKTKRPTTVPRNWARSGSTAFHLRQPGPSRSSGGEGRGSLRDNTVKNTVPVWLPKIVRPNPATVSNVHHRSPNPAIVSGLANSKTRQSGEISGTLMHRIR
jgi:hypothetical protein